MQFHLLPDRTAGAAENMATDFMLLQRYPNEQDIRFRHYDWHRPAFTFGYSQKIEFVRGQLPAGEVVELCRRPTGGGVVDHRADWTYALVVPRGHPAYDVRATESYRIVHACIAEAFRALKQPAVLHERPAAAPDGKPAGPGICFIQAELYDVISPANGRKIAGAAQKRTKHGLLFQGSIARQVVSAQLDWEAFRTGFLERLAAALGVQPEETPWPDWSDEELAALVEQYSTPEWNEFR
ncbi:lipoate--protein ligase family protein [Opitutaceae bacterium EW11]|nr:lipoate--protein ligase family protein [Opitutaceae bacterium EW11]